MKNIAIIAAIAVICLCLTGCGDKNKITYERIPQPDGTYKIGVCDPKVGCYVIDDVEGFDGNLNELMLPRPAAMAD